jgi:hypothetical protein
LLFGKYSVVSVFSKGALTIDQSESPFSYLKVGADIFSPIEACDEEQGSMVHPCDRRDEEHNEERRKKIKPKRLFGVIWSSE